MDGDVDDGMDNVVDGGADSGKRVLVRMIVRWND